MKLNYPAALFQSLREFCSWCDQASVLEEYTVAPGPRQLPSPAGRKRIVLVTDAAGGEIPAFNTSTDWRRVDTRAVVT